MTDESVLIEKNSRINGAYHKLVFRSTALSAGVQPGQFMQVRLQEGTVPFLRRPFSYYRAEKGRVEVLYEVLGKGTAILSGKQPGETLRVLGPLGKGFSKDTRGRRRILVAGGIGVPPLIFLAERWNVDHLLVGIRTPKFALPAAETSRVRTRVRYACEQGGRGIRGLVTLPLERLLSGLSHPGDYFIQTCGPRGMMQAVMDLAARYGIEGEASLDESMACGIGACLGCVVQTEDGVVPSCTCGPVFPFDKIKQRLVAARPDIVVRKKVS
jgi:dihydroorotate dehydrogenase electron transfer subunit